MSMVDTTETAVTRRGFSPHWGRTTTTTIEDEQPDISTASGVTPIHVAVGDLFVAWMRQRIFRAEQVGLFEGASGSSGIVTHFFNAWAGGSVAAGQHRTKGLSSLFYADELLDWDFAVEAEPKCVPRTLKVMLKYVPPGSSAPFENPGD